MEIKEHGKTKERIQKRVHCCMKSKLYSEAEKDIKLLLELEPFDNPDLALLRSLNIALSSQKGKQQEVPNRID